MISRLILVTIALGAVGCTALQRKHDDYLVTPAGRKIYQLEDRGSFSQGFLTRARVLEDLDAQIATWLDQRSAQYGRDRCLKIANTVGYYLRDHFEFQISATEYAHGMTNPGSVWACLWSQAWSAAAPPQGTPPWTIVFNAETGNWNYGVLQLVDGRRRTLEVIPHELDHHLGINHE